MRKYNKAVGSRSYRNYSTECVTKAIDEVTKKKKSLKSTAKKYNIPLGTLYNKVHGRHKNCSGGQTRLSAACESLLAAIILTLAEWMVPIGSAEVRALVRDYLDKKLPKGQELFKHNTPGIDWVQSFMKRHNLTKRKATNVNRYRAKVTPPVVKSYFEYLGEELHGLPPSNVFNYDETNLTDDPGSQIVIVSRGAKRVERISPAEFKAGTSVMFCGNAAGLYLPPMVVYKCRTENVYEGWRTGGPAGALYESTQSGWFNMRCFGEWFFGVFLPHVQSVESDHAFALIGDNLPSHFSADVITATLQHNIRFITMPAASTHLCQPLDVAVFRTLKVMWRDILTRWRRSTRRLGAVSKVCFPGLLAELCATLEPRHLVSGFKASGIYPLDASQVLNRLPGAKARVEEAGGCAKIFNEAVLNLLQTQCGQAQQQPTARRGRKITPGKRIVEKPQAAPSAKGGKRGRKKDDLCAHCNEPYAKDDGNRWIYCPVCKKWFHFQCSGVQYSEEDYYDFNIVALADFKCTDCS